MKIRIILPVIILIACSALAQQPTPAPSPSPTPQPVALHLPPQTQAALMAGNIISQVTNLMTSVIQVLDNGVPAQPPNQPAIDAKDIQAALGAENVMKLRSVAAMLTGQPPAPAQSPSPEQK
jgi:hypothetical protein